ncbi:MAG: HAMP domain-containing protein [Proteobacteria bacterium]|nr:HAMP domain-containing protein [Pseudomonadota bacterium]MBU4470468.1 HAMP domain-containing protein [Pseudomonadota bacterium]MCG2753521.1 ATP-binding protein [Desulfobacteraceae bacterium]
MFSKSRFKVLRTLAFRLTLWYAGVSIFSSGIAFLLFYVFINTFLQNATDQELLSRDKELSSLMHLNGIEAVKRVVVLEAQAAGEKKIFVRLLYPDGTTFSSSNMSFWKNIEISRESLKKLLQDQKPVIETTAISQKHKVRILYGIIGPGILLQLGQSMENQTRFIEAFQRMFMAVMAALIVFSAWIGWFMARRATLGVEAVTKTAKYIAEGAMDERVPLNQRDDEINELAMTFNRMLDHIQTLVQNIKDISDNIAHDLRSPITRIRGLAEVTLTTPGSMNEFENMAASTIEECDRLLDMINTMLVISKTEAGVVKKENDLISMDKLAEQACELFLPAAEDKDIVLAFRNEGPFQIHGDRPMIQRMIANLLDNAIKYTPSGGSVTLRTYVDSGKTGCVEVMDTGIGISQKDLDPIFERFYRCDQSRSMPGTGLGLSLAKAVARSHGGTISVTSTPGKGSIFLIRLPLAEPLQT